MDRTDLRKDHLDSFHLCVKALRERGVRSGAIAPINDDERRQAKEGICPTPQFDCVREADQ